MLMGISSLSNLIFVRQGINETFTWAFLSFTKPEPLWKEHLRSLGGCLRGSGHLLNVSFSPLPSPGNVPTFVCADL